MLFFFHSLPLTQHYFGYETCHLKALFISMSQRERFCVCVCCELRPTKISAYFNIQNVILWDEQVVIEHDTIHFFFVWLLLLTNVSDFLTLENYDALYLNHFYLLLDKKCFLFLFAYFQSECDIKSSHNRLLSPKC